MAMFSNAPMNVQALNWDPSVGKARAIAGRNAMRAGELHDMQMDKGVLEMRASKLATDKEAQRLAFYGGNPSAEQQKAFLLQSGDTTGLNAFNTNQRAAQKGIREQDTFDQGTSDRNDDLIAETMFGAPEGQWAATVEGLFVGGKIGDEHRAKLLEMPDAPESRELMGAYGMSVKDQTAQALATDKFAETGRHNLAMESKPTAGTTIHMGGNAEKKAYGQFLVKSFEGVQDAANVAFTANRQLDMLRSIDVNQGKAEPYKVAIAAWGQSLGVDPAKFGLKDPTNAQTYIALSKKMLLSAMAAQKGPQTEADMRVIADTIAKLGNTNEANRFIIDASIAVNNRRIAKAAFFDKQMGEEGTFRGAEAAWSSAMGKIPFMAPNKNTGRPVFFDSWLETMTTNSPDADPKELREQWRATYGT